jgi:hypothetical protein
MTEKEWRAGHDRFCRPGLRSILGNGGDWLGHGSRSLGRLHLAYEAIPSPGKGLDVTRLAGRVPQDVAQSFHCGINTMVELDDDVVRPEAFPNLLACDDFAWRFEQHPEDQERLLLQPDPAPLFAQFSAPKIERKRPKADIAGRGRRALRTIQLSHFGFHQPCWGV